jgi:glycosyltransferase involved in cell wall biosynthesis
LIDLEARHVFSSLAAVARYLKQYRPAVMSTDKDRGNRTAILARAWAGIPTRLAVSSGTTISIDLANRGRFERWLQKYPMRYFYPLADNIIANSKGVADDMAAYTGLEREWIKVVPRPVVSENLFHDRLTRPNHPWFQPDEPPVILGVGELGPRKDFVTLIKAYAKLRDRTPSRLFIIGKGKDHDPLHATAQQLGVAKDVDLPGFVPYPYPYTAHAGLLAMTSRWEGLGFVLIKAVAVGTPAVSAKCPSGPSEILDGGRYGQLVPIGDVNGLVHAMYATLIAPLPAAIIQKAARPYEIENSTTAYLAAMGLRG